MPKVFVCDDDTQILSLVAAVLEAAGHDVVATSRPRDVQVLASTEQPHAIILDVLMPVSGYELLDGLRQEPSTADIPVLFLSGLSEGHDRVRGLKVGADDYLVKPFEPVELVLRVERLISHREAGPARAAGADRTGFGRYFGRYEVLGVLGRGSMGIVYRGLDPRLRREVVLKTIRLDGPEQRMQRRELLELLEQEAVTVAHLNHANVISVFDMGSTLTSAYLAMELVDGLSLDDVIVDQGPLSSAQLMALALPLASGLAATHEREIIHRDVKPSNVLLGRGGEIKLGDFGLAAFASAVRPSDGETVENTLAGRVRPLDDVGDVEPVLERLLTELLAVDLAARPTAAETVDRLRAVASRRDLRWRVPEMPLSSPL